jgi:colanic acid/amylovoran biosynthesis glycosyltransferase
MTVEGSLLIVIPSVVITDGKDLRVEADFVNNLQIYSSNFESVVFACPALSEDQNEGYILRSVPIREIPFNTHFVRIPYTYREDVHLSHYFSTRRLLRKLIAEADYLLFSPHAPFDWPTLAAREAIRSGRKFDIECDLDWNNLMRFRIAQTRSKLKRARVRLLAKLLKRDVDYCLAHSAVALLQGKEVFEAYRDIAPNPRMVLNVQVDERDHIPAKELQEKIARIRSGAPLKIIYAGRINERKGALDWVKAVRSSGLDISATWYGDGPDRESMKSEATGLPIVMRGVRPRNEIMEAMRESDVFLFCHKVAESPRCLSEALASGIPIVGYRSAFPQGLVEAHGGGAFVDIGDWQGLGSLIAELDHDRDRLVSLVLAAAATGRSLDRNSAMQHRIDLIKEHLSV